MVVIILSITGYQQNANTLLSVLEAPTDPRDEDTFTNRIAEKTDSLMHALENLYQHENVSVEQLHKRSEVELDL